MLLTYYRIYFLLLNRLVLSLLGMNLTILQFLTVFIHSGDFMTFYEIYWH